MMIEVGASALTPLILSFHEITALNTAISDGLGSAVGFDHRRQLRLMKLDNPASIARNIDYGMVEAGNPILVVDDRGTQKSAIPFHSWKHQHLLLSLNFSWYKISNRCARFVSAHMTVFIAWGNTRVRQATKHAQLLRLEWEGVNEDGAFEAQIAAHPHWQVDRWLAGYDPERDRLRTAMQRAGDVRNFDDAMDVALPADVRWMRSIHLAAAARWSTVRWDGDAEHCLAHADGPADAEQVQNWTLSAVRYVTQHFRTAFDRIG